MVRTASIRGVLFQIRILMMAIPALDHGVIGNGQVIALVSPTTHIDWLCLPRFDSPSISGLAVDAPIEIHRTLLPRRG